MRDFDKETIVKEVMLVLGKDGVLEQQIAAAAQKQAITIEELVKRRLAMGVSVENIRAEIIADLEAEAPRLFGGFRVDLKNAVYGASNMARSLGAGVALGEDGNKLWRWQTNGTNICEDCLERNGEIDSYAAWEVRGLPTMFGSRCAENCLCTLVPEELVMEPIQVGQED